MKLIFCSLVALAVSATAFAANPVCGSLLNPARPQAHGLELIKVESEKFFSIVFDGWPSKLVESMDLNWNDGRLNVTVNNKPSDYLNQPEFSTKSVGPGTTQESISKQFGNAEGFWLTHSRDNSQVLILAKQKSNVRFWEVYWWVKPTVQNSMRVPVGIGDATYSWGVIDIPGGWRPVATFAQIESLNFHHN